MFIGMGLCLMLIEDAGNIATAFPRLLHNYLDIVHMPTLSGLLLNLVYMPV